MSTSLAGTSPLARAAGPAAPGPFALPRMGRFLLVAIPFVWGSAFVVGYVTALWLLTGAGLVLTVAGLARPRLGLLGVGILACLDASSRVYLFTGGLFRWNTIAYLLLLAAIVYFRDLQVLWSLPGALLVLLTLLLAVGLLWTPDRTDGLEHLLGLSAVFGMVGFCLRGGHAPAAWVWTARVTTVLAAAGGPVFFLLRADLRYMNPNAWAYLPVTALLLAAVASTVAPPEGRSDTILPLGVAVNLGWTFLSGSRGSLVVGLVAAGLFSWNWRRRRRGKRAIVGAVVAAAVCLAFFPDLLSGMQERLVKSVEGDRSLANRTSGRSDLAIVGWRIFLDNPMGVGTGGFAEVAKSYGWAGNLAVYRTHEELQAHSAWIKTLSENGAAGLVLFGGFVGSFAVVGWRRRAHGVAMLGAAISLILAVAFLSTEFQAKGLWLFATAGLVIVPFRRRPDRPRRPDPAPVPSPSWRRGSRQK